MLILTKIPLCYESHGIYSMLPTLFVGMTIASHVVDRITIPAEIPEIQENHNNTSSLFLASHTELSHEQRRIKLRNRLCISIFALLILTLYYFEISTVAGKLWGVVASAPSGFYTSPHEIVNLCAEVKHVAEGQLVSVTMLLMFIYLCLQTFCIPGTIAINAICGALLGVKVGLPLCVLAGTVGASSCYILSSVAGNSLAEYVDRRLMKSKGVPKLRAAVQKYKNDLFAYLLFLRLTPFLPNWLINLASPVVHVPLRHFAIATFLGITPQTYLSVRFGTLATATGVRSIVSIYDTVVIALCGTLILLGWKLRKKFDDGREEPKVVA